jgi:hypothetical protein
MSGADIIDEDAIELPQNLITALDSCRRLVANPKADKRAMFERGATDVFRTVTQADGKLWQVAINTLYDIGYGIGLDDTAGQEILDAARAKSFALPPDQDPIYQSWEANDPRNKRPANGHDAEPAPSEDAYGTVTAKLPATIADAAIVPAKFITPAAWPNEAPPPVDWLVASRIPRGDVTTLHGDGRSG